jgi:hypothetical protein
VTNKPTWGRGLVVVAGLVLPVVLPVELSFSWNRAAPAMLYPSAGVLLASSLLLLAASRILRRQRVAAQARATTR